MKTFAIIDNGKVARLAVAEDITILGALLPDEDLVLEVTEKTGAAYVGAEYRKNKFVPFNNYESWTWNETKWAWQPPVAYPTDGKNYGWDDEGGSWIDLTGKTDTLA